MARVTAVETDIGVREDDGLGSGVCGVGPFAGVHGLGPKSIPLQLGKIEFWARRLQAQSTPTTADALLAMFWEKA